MHPLTRSFIQLNDWVNDMSLQHNQTTALRSRETPRSFNPWIVAVVVTIGTFMEVLDTSIANVALPHIAGSLSASQDEGAWVLSSYLVANAIVLPISGWLSSYMGRRNYFVTSVVLFTIFSFACGLAPTLGLLIAFRALQGLAGGGLQPSVQAILTDTFTPEQRAMGMSLYTIAILCAPVLGPTAGGWITDNFSWRWIFYINVPIGIGCAALSRLVLHDPPYMTAAKEKARKLSVDWGGLALISIGLGSLEIVLDKGQELDWFGSHFIISFSVVAVAAISTAIWWELHRPNPMVNLRLLKETNFLFCCLLILGLYGVLFATTYLLPLFLQQMLGYSATDAGTVLSPAGLITMVEIPLVGYVLTKGFDPRKMIVAGLIILVTGIWWMSSLNLEISKISVILPRIWQVLGLGLITVPVSTVVFQFLPQAERSQASGLYALVRNEGASLGIALAGTMLQRKTQIFQQTQARNLTSSSPIVQETLSRMGGGFGSSSDHQYLAMARLYSMLQRQALLLAYMDTFRTLACLMIFVIPLAFFLKRPKVASKKVDVEAH